MDLAQLVNHNNPLLLEENRLKIHIPMGQPRSPLLLMCLETLVYRAGELILHIIGHQNRHQVNDKMTLYLLQILRHPLINQMLRNPRTSNPVLCLLIQSTSLSPDLLWQVSVQRLSMHRLRFSSALCVKRYDMLIWIVHQTGQVVPRISRYLQRMNR